MVFANDNSDSAESMSRSRIVEEVFEPDVEEVLRISTSMRGFAADGEGFLNFLRRFETVLGELDCAVFVFCFLASRASLRRTSSKMNM